MNITGSLIEAYIFCPRQAWLMVRQISGDQFNDFLEIGRLISQTTFKKDKKEINTKTGKIDLIKKYNGEIIIIEVKKSSKFIECAKMQLLFYLNGLHKKGYFVKGEIHIPNEKKIIKLKLSIKEKEKLLNIIKEIKETISSHLPPKIVKSRKCSQCSYNEFCFS